MPKPTAAMQEAAKKGLDALKAAQADLTSATVTRAQKIAEGVDLSDAHVKRMHAFFSEATAQRPDGDVTGTPWQIAWNLWGGDAGKPWAAKLSKLGLSDDEPIVFKELFFESAAPSGVAEDGLIYKELMRTGIWSEGPNGKPLQVIAGHSPNPKEVIGLQDLVDNFNDGAIEHVTIPKTHADLVDENTGQVKKLMIKPRSDGGYSLIAGKHFTDKGIEKKVLEGSILNNSAGIEFDYVRKEDGKKYDVILRHSALTNRPWINRLAPFGLSDDRDYEMHSLVFSEEQPPTLNEFSESPWDAVLSTDEIKAEIEAALSPATVIGMAMDRVLISRDGKRLVANFSVEENKVVLSEEGSWILLADEPEEAPVTPPADPAHDEEVVIDSTTVPPTTLPEPTDDDPSSKKEPISMPEPTIAELQEQLAAEKARNAANEASIAQLSTESRTNRADKFVKHLTDLGLSEKAGFAPMLTEVRTIMLADEGKATLQLSQDGTQVDHTATSLLERVFGAMPKDETSGKFKIDLSEMHQDPLGTSPSTKPPREGEDETVHLSERDPDAFKAQQDELYAEIGKHDRL